MAARGEDPLAALNEELRRQPEKHGSEWLALESNPQVFDAFGRHIGVPDGWEFVDVLGLDKELLELVRRPVAALILLFPCTPGIYAARRRQDEALRAGKGVPQEDLFFLKQVADFGNACGTIACLHTISNSRHVLQMAADAPLERFVRAQAAASPEARGRALLEANELKAPSDAAAVDAAAQTACPARDGPPLDHHFVALVRSPGNRLIELDGTKRGPVDHGATSEGTFLVDAAAVVRRDFVEVDPDVHGFVLMALARRLAAEQR